MTGHPPELFRASSFYELGMQPVELRTGVLTKTLVHRPTLNHIRSGGCQPVKSLRRRGERNRACRHFPFRNRLARLQIPQQKLGIGPPDSRLQLIDIRDNANPDELGGPRMEHYSYWNEHSGIHV